MVDPNKRAALAKAKAYQQAGGQSSYSEQSPLLAMLQGAHPFSVGGGGMSPFGDAMGDDGGNEAQWQALQWHPLYAAFGRAFMQQRKRPQYFDPFGGQ